MKDIRPDPDALLARVRAESGERREGRLKIFFGMCAGVGKTYAMLQEAHERQQSGVDVVAGYIETHKRPETDALKKDLPELPAKRVEYRGIALREFDLDAALARKPGLILVDELAHTNAEGLRHTQRYQDILELLDAGIDVYTTVNVQHVESLNDVVAQITGIPVRETIPDSIIERADEIELVDIPPDDLLQRLHEGRIYVPEQVRSAVDRFFRRENLIALRELALRETAARVSAQVLVERAGLGETRPWATSERILVCVGPSPLSTRVIRIARRMAAASKAEWMAVSVDKPGQSDIANAQARRNLKLAERLGAEPVVISGERVADEILAYAIKRNVTKIVVGKPALPRWREWLRGSVVDELIRRSGEIDVHVVNGGTEDEPALPASELPKRATDWKGYAWATAVLIVCTALVAIAFPFFSAVNLTVIYLAGVVFVATRHATGPSVFAAVMSALFFDFFFTKPYYTFAVSDTEYIVAMAGLLGTGLVVSGLAQRVRRQGEAARTRYLRTLALYFMSRKLAATADREALAQFSARHIADVFGCETAVLLADTAGQLMTVARHGEFAVELPNEKAAARWVFEHQKWAGWSTETLAAAQAIYLPLVASDRSFGVLALRPRDARSPMEPDQRHLLETFATQLAIALERTAFASEAEAAKREAETEQVRNSLLSCVSHDLRTPLAAIAGAASTLVDGSSRLSMDSQKELAQSIAEEAARLNQLVSKLLDMTRLEAAGFRLVKEWYPIDELIGAALNRLQPMLIHHRIETSISHDLPLLHVDGPLMEEVIGNLLENAARYTPPGSLIAIRATVAGQGMLVEVTDNGPGLQPGTERDIFRRFVRRRPADDRRGTGLGLAICEAVVRLHAGDIAAANRPEGGARFWFTIPLTEGAPNVAAETESEFAASDKHASSTPEALK